MTNDTTVGDSSINYQFDKEKIKGKWKGALARTKSKFQKKEPSEREFKLSEDVNDFLSAGKPRPSVSDRLTPSASPSSTPNGSSTDLSRLQASPRGISVPRLDTSQTSRFPQARPVDVQYKSKSSEYLLPYESNQRSQSLSSFKKKRPRPRNLSVSFDSKPPVIIGLGGDEAEQPTVEISRLRQRSRSLSPMPPPRPSSKGSSHSNNSASSQSSIRRKPVPVVNYRPTDPIVNPADDPDFVPKPLSRAPTGGTDFMRPADVEFEMSMQTPDTAGEDHGHHFKTEVVSPKPIRPPVAPPEASKDQVTADTDRTLPMTTRPTVGSTPQANQRQISPSNVNVSANTIANSNHNVSTVKPFIAEDVISSTPLKPGAVRVTITNDDLPLEPTLPDIDPYDSHQNGPPLPPRRNPMPPVNVNVVPATPVGPRVPPTVPPTIQQKQQMLAQRPKPSLNETETMQQGAHGWL